MVFPYLISFLITSNDKADTDYHATETNVNKKLFFTITSQKCVMVSTKKPTFEKDILLPEWVINGSQLMTWIEICHECMSFIGNIEGAELVDIRFSVFALAV